MNHVMYIIAGVAIAALIIVYATGAVTGFTESATLSPIAKSIDVVGTTAKINLHLINPSSNSIEVQSLQLIYSDTEYDLNTNLITNSTVPAHSDFSISGLMVTTSNATIGVISGDNVLVTVQYQTNDGIIHKPNFKIKVS